MLERKREECGGRNYDNSFVRGMNVKKLRHVPGTVLCRANGSGMSMLASARDSGGIQPKPTVRQKRVTARQTPAPYACPRVASPQ